MSWQVRTLVASVELGNQFIHDAGTLATLTDSEYGKLSASAFATPTTLSASASAGATSISTPVSIPAGTTIYLDGGANFEQNKVTNVTGSGPYTLTVSATKKAHASGAPVAFGSGHLALVGQVANTGDTVNAQATHVANAAALTSAQVSAAPTQANFNALQADVAALQSKLNALIGALQVANGPMASS